VPAIVRRLAAYNGWPTSKSALRTRVARYYRLVKTSTLEGQHLRQAAAHLLPMVAEDFQPKK
jgi:hypothetical protein